MVATVRTPMAQGRGLLTERERELLADADADEQKYKYQAASRARARINEEVTADVAVLEEHHPQLLAELRAVVCDGEDGEVSGE